MYDAPVLLLLFGFGLPILAAVFVSALPIKSDGDRSAVLWALVAPAAIGGAILGAWLDTIL